MNNWKNPILLITGVGVSYLGNWIYLIALNLAILNLTGSAAAVAGLFIIRPIAVLLTNMWSGSVIDRVNKRKLMIMVDVIRGILIFTIPFISSLWAIYSVMLLVNIAGSFFGPSSQVYITKLVPSENRKRFNSIMSMTSSGAFLLGPAIAGVLIMKFSTDLCIIINAITFFICAFFIFLLPNVDEQMGKGRDPVKWKTLVSDWKIVTDFSKSAKYFMSVYLLFQSAMLIGFALDSQEVTFIKRHLDLTDRDYGLIVSITGIGAIVGASVSAMTAKRLSLRLYLGAGMLLTSIGYVLFYASINFITATVAFVFLGFFMAFANSGYATFFQKNVPLEIMGRFGSMADMAQGFIQIGLTLILGFFAELYSLQMVCLLFSGLGVFIAVVLLLTIFKPNKLEYYEEKTEHLAG
ncbi:MFS transporter [Bacillus sp. CGMCC 1.16607]|uniref:MFS transporter n=1 Tax=Bacillus sp. CGMCC 1.16607 TaxID=3351842 RepID=UPI0036364A0B